MPEYCEIRADYDANSIVVYQAYSPAIAVPSLKAGKFVSPFSLNRMTWIKPSFLWMMERSGWGRKAGQEYVLAVRITRAGWEEALSNAVLTTYAKSIYGSPELWQRRFDEAAVRVQWDPERSIRGAKLDYRSVQVGLSRHSIKKYVDEWVIGLKDLTVTVHKMYELLHSGHIDAAKRLLPKERVYPIPADIARKIGASSS